MPPNIPHIFFPPLYVYTHSSVLLSHLKIIHTHQDTLPSYLSMDLLSLRTFYYLTKVWLSFSSEFLTFIKMVPNFRYSLATCFIQLTLDFWNLSMLVHVDLVNSLYFTILLCWFIYLFCIYSGLCYRIQYTNNCSYSCSMSQVKDLLGNKICASSILLDIAKSFLKVVILI